MGDTGRPCVRTATHAGEITPRIDLQQQVLNAHEGQRSFDGAAQGLHPGWAFAGIAPFQVKPVASDRGKIIVGHAALSPLSHRIACLLKT